jgi:hypothetical protein
MRDQELVNALRRLKVETGSLACLGCGHEHNCGVSGCAIIREATDRIANQNTHIAALQLEIEKLRAQVEVRPYRIGETVYVLLQDGAIFYPETNGWYISKEVIGAISPDGFYLGDPVDDVYTPDSEIGKTVFLTSEEAKAALEAKRDG